MKFEKYPDERDEWRWRLVADNGKTIADSGEGYSSQRACDHGIDLVKSCKDAEVVTLPKVTRPSGGSVKLTRVPPRPK